MAGSAAIAVENVEDGVSVETLACEALEAEFAGDAHLSRMSGNSHAATSCDELRKIRMNLLFQPQHEEALKNLGMCWYNGELLTNAQIQQRQADARQAVKEPDEHPSRES
jgi:hypothetical protein